MASREDYAARPLPERLARLEGTPDELAAAARDRTDRELSHRPDGRNWSAKEVVCHLRDIEELCMLRFRLMLAMDEPKVPVAGARPTNPTEWGLVGSELPVDPDRWAEERQYGRSDVGAALAAFRKRREESLASLGRLTFSDWTALIAAHDDNHLDQLRRALEGRP